MDQRQEMKKASRISLAQQKAWAKTRELHLAEVSGRKPPFLTLRLSGLSGLSIESF
jgi:hypothetical protein